MTKPVKIYDFLGKRYIAYVISVALIVLSAYQWFSTGEDKYGIDYLGGHELILRIENPEADSESIREQLAADEIEATVQAFEIGSSEFSVRISGEEKSAVVRDGVVASLSKQFPDDVEVLKADFVGPTVGQELRKDALIAILLSLVGMLIYITYRFEMAFAVGVVVALFHDVAVTMGIYLWLDNTVSVATLAAALTIVGYSANDTIVIFDRVREEILRRKDFDLMELINYSITATLSRTIITSLLTLFSALALLIYGGGAIEDFSLFLCIGLVAGCYSTIFIAAPVALAWENFRNRSGESSQTLPAGASAEQ